MGKIRRLLGGFSIRTAILELLHQFFKHLFNILLYILNKYII